MIDVNEAVKIARKYFTDLQKLQNTPVQSLRVEEVEMSGAFWLITLGYTTSLFASVPTYKVIKIDGETEQVVSMKMRQV